ncbi:unnamed protein product [Trichobilharzia szidati]|nr:unnamed protein product [Trichobilharzia szidati]
MLPASDLFDSSSLQTLIHTTPSDLLSTSQQLNFLTATYQIIVSTLYVVIGIVCFVLLSLILVFWCIYEKRSCTSSGKKESVVKLDAEETPSVEKLDCSSVLKNYSSLSTNTEKLNDSTKAKSSLSGLLKFCGISLDCCPVFHFITKKPDDTVLFQASINEYGTNSTNDTVNSLKDDSTPAEATVKKSTISHSPSIANRRHQPPPPRLFTPSLMATSPPVETQLYHIQPKDFVYNQTCKPIPSSLMLQNDGLGACTVTATQLLHGPLLLNTSADLLHSQCTPCESQSAPCSQTSVTTQPLSLLNPPFCHTIYPASNSLAQELTPQLPSSSTSSTCNGGTQVPKTYPGVGFNAGRRVRSKGLLESRRGSRTSLTLSLSPSIDSPTPSCSVGSAQFSVFGGSLDEDACTAEVLSEENETGNNADYCNNSDDDNIDSNNNNNGDAIKQFPSRCGYLQSLDSYSPSAISTSKQAESMTVSPLTNTSSNVCNIGTISQVNNSDDANNNNNLTNNNDTTTITQIGFNKKGRYLMNNRCNYMCYHHHHHHHHRHHFHHFAIHHCKLDSGFPCSLGNLTCQRNRDLEQLINASLPLTYDQLKTKLRDNSTVLFQEFWAIPMNYADKKELPIPGICHKNRYQSILPNFATRVVLPVINNDLTSSYINANYIRGYKGRPNAFIATQGVMPHTINDFWRMIWYSHTPAIVMITKLVENKEVKCELYLPDSSGEDVLSFAEDQSCTGSVFSESNFKSNFYTNDTVVNRSATTTTTTTTTTNTINSDISSIINSSPPSSVPAVTTNPIIVPNIKNFSSSPLLPSLSSPPINSQSSTSSYRCVSLTSDGINTPASVSSTIPTPVSATLIDNEINLSKRLHDSGIASVEEQSSIITENSSSSNTMLSNNKNANNNNTTLEDNHNDPKLSTSDPCLDFYQSIALPGACKTFGNIHVRILSLEKHNGYLVRRLQLKCGTEEREIFHFWYVSWPDHSSPETATSARSLIQLVETVESCRRKSSPSSESSGVKVNRENPDDPILNCQKKLPTSKCFHSSSYRPNLMPSLQKVELEQLNDEDTTPIVVHCSAGLGRTGCFIALCIGCEQLKKEGQVDVLKIVSRMRLDRGGMVQSNEQYEFIHYALTTYPLEEKPSNAESSTVDSPPTEYPISRQNV